MANSPENLPLAVNVPINSEVNTVLPESGTGYTTYNREPDGNDQYGTPSTIQAIQEIGKIWAKNHPEILLNIGDISRKNGGYFAGHSTKNHHDGRDFDIRPINKQGTNNGVNIKDPDYSPELTKDLVKIIKNNFPNSIITFNDPDLIREGLTEEKPGHNNYLHVHIP